MKKRIVICLLCAALFGCLIGCDSAQEAVEQENICVYPATTDQFDSMEDFLDFAAAAESGNSLSDIASLECFWLPKALPEGYKLCKINATKMDIGFYYLPADADLSEESIRTVDINKDHIQFISSRGEYKFESEMAQFGVTAEDLIDGKYILHEYAEKMMLVWKEDGNVLMLYLPRQYVFEDWGAMCVTEKYTKNTQGRFVNKDGEDACDSTA